MALSVAAMFAFISADERRLAGILAWLARDWTTPDEAFNIAVCNYDLYVHNNCEKKKLFAS